MKLPAGLEGNGVEIFRGKDGKVRVINNGHRNEYLDLPLALREPFQAELIADIPATNCIVKEMRITDPDEMEELFVGCRYGALDGVADLKDGTLTHDLPVCDKIGTCPGFGIICKQPSGKGGTISRREYQVIILVAKGKLDKEIASELNIELPTVRTYLSRIREKLCVNNRIEIALWAHNRSII